MDSVPYSLPSILTDRWLATRWPATFERRTLLRLLLCCPYLALAAWSNHRGYHSPANIGLWHQATPVYVFSSRLTFLARSYPPIPTLLAALVPGGINGLALLGALAAGGLLHLAWERLLRAEVPHWLIAVLLVGLGAAPIFCFNATQNLVGFLGLACFAVAMAGMLDFLFAGRTSSGFVAGLSLGLAVLCDPAALVYAASVLIGAPLLAWERFRRNPQAIASTMAVLVYPTFAFLGAWAFLEWRFTGTVWHQLPVAPDAFRFPHGVTSGLSAVLGHVGRQLICAPVFLLSWALVLRRRPVAFLAFLAVPLDLIVSAWIGLHTPTEQGLVLLNLLGVLAVPSRPGRVVSVLYLVAVPLGVLLSILYLDGTTIEHYLHAIGL
jgi:hypothetical protein